MLKKIFWVIVVIYLVFLVAINSHEVPFNYPYGDGVGIKLDFIIVLSFAAGILFVLISNFIVKSQKFFSDVLSYSANKKKKKLKESFDEALKYIELENSDKAKEILIAYLKEEAGNIDAYLYLSDIYLDEGLYHEAEETLKSAAVAGKSDVKILNRLCNVYTQSNKFDKAISIYREIMEKEDDKSFYLKKIYDIYVFLKDYKRAYNIQKDLIKDASFEGSDDEFLTTKYNIALLYIDDGDLKRAEKELKDVIDEDSRFYAAYISYADVLIKKGDKAAALAFLTESFNETKFSYFAKLIEKIYLEEEKPQKALLFYQEQLDRIAPGAAVSKGPEAWKDSQALVLYALYINLLVQLEMIDHAVDAVNDVVGTEDDKKVFHLFLAECYMRHNNFFDAADQYQEFFRSRKLHPIMFRCVKCGAGYEDFAASCKACGTYNKINYFIS